LGDELISRWLIRINQLKCATTKSLPKRDSAADYDLQNNNSHAVEMEELLVGVLKGNECFKIAKLRIAGIAVAISPKQRTPRPRNESA
jgi:hypothetical protein